MAMWCEELSASARAGLLADIDLLNPKNGRVYLRLMLYIARFGSAPADDRLAEHLGVTKRYWKERAWPSLEDMFEIRGNRIFHPEIGGAPDSRRKAAAQVAAQARWGSKPQVISGSEDGHHGRVTASESHTESHVNSMRGASESHADFDANAYSDASPDASGASLARSPSLASLTSFQPTDQSIESKEESERESGDARASAYAPTHAQGMPSDAITHPVTAPQSHLNGHANVVSDPGPIPSVKIPIPDDWQPTAEAIKEMESRGLDAGLIAKKYRAWCRTEGKESKDHHATFELFYLKERPPQHSPSSGGQPQHKPPSNGFDALVLRDGFAGGYRGAGRVVDGKAEPNPVLDYLASEEAKKNAG